MSTCGATSLEQRSWFGMICQLHLQVSDKPVKSNNLTLTARPLPVAVHQLAEICSRKTSADELITSE